MSQAATAIRIALCIAALSSCLVRCGQADPVSIDKVRLFEEQTGQYVLEVDSSPLLLPAYREPVLPERFELTDFQRESQSGYLVLRYRFRSLGEPLDVDDELLLPWGRSGASITAQWSDGSVHQNLFLRDFEGIRVPIRMLKPSQRSETELAVQYLQTGLAHGSLSWNHWLLVAVVGLLTSGWWRIGLILCFAAGDAISLVVTDLGVLVVPGQAAEICVVVVALLIARAAPLNDDRSRQFVPILLILGLLHGVANAKALLETGVRESDVVQALFWFNLGIDTFQIVAVSAVAALAIVISRVPSLHAAERIVRVSVGGAAFGVLLIALAGGRTSHHTHVASQRESGSFELPGAQMVSSVVGSCPQPPRELQEPLAIFLSIEPFEVRLEVLVRLAHTSDWIDLPADQKTIEIDHQEMAKQEVIDLIAQRSALHIDGSTALPAVRRADFVTVEPNGIYSRSTPVTEPLDDAIIGVTFVYDTIKMADEAKLEWNLFSSEIKTIPSTTTDPFGGRKHELSPDGPDLAWKNRWSGYRPPEIKPVAVSKPRFPLLSVLLVAVAGGGYWLLGSGDRRWIQGAATVVLLTTAFVIYPFVRVSVGAPFAVTWRPSSEEATDILDRLLTNVYRAYDMRDEEAIYDRLALTITGEQLTEIYLDTRRSLELENRGGARAKVDEVEIFEVHSVTHADGGFAVELTWTVSGSVTHFGHTHYRRNRYRATATIVPADGNWKIQSIEVGEQQRML